MPPSRGFARGDFDTSFPLDDRFQELAVVLSRPLYLQAVGVYWLVIASAWREADRKPVERIAVGTPERVVSALIQVGLIGEDHLLCETSFERWVGAALGRRRSDADRARVVRTPTDSDGIQTTPPESSLARAGAHTDGSGRDGTGSDSKTTARETPRQQVYRWLQEHGASNPTGWVIKALDELIKVYGPETITGLWATAPSDVKTSKQFFQFAERNLSPAIHGKTQGHTRTAQEGRDAFDS